MNTHHYFAFIGFANALTTFLTGIYVYSRAPKHPLNRSFFAYAVSVSLWSGFYAVWQLQDSHAAALLAMRLTMVPCYFIPFTFTWFVFHVVGRTVQNKLLLVLMVVPSIFAAVNFTRFGVADVVPRLYFPYWPVGGWMMHIYLVLYFAVLGLDFYLLFKASNKVSGPRRRLIYWVAYPMLFGFVGGSSNWFLWYNISIPPFPNVFVAVVFMFLGYGIMRWQLFDLEDLAAIVREVKLSSIGLLTTSINHEIRNPLYIIKGLAESYLSNLEDGIYPGKDETIAKSAEIMRKTIEQSARAMDIMKRFASYAKEEVGRVSTVTAVSLSEVLENILPLVNHELELDKIELVKDIPRDLPQVCADPRHLEEIFFNLIVNACHAIKEAKGEGRIEIKARRAQHRVLIEVSDNGPGIPADKLGHIFDPFYTTKKQGTGLGLYLTKQLVEKNGGRISVSSEHGENTVFALELKVGE